MRVLITGDRGRVGSAVTAAVRARGWIPVGFDIVDGLDVRDADAVRRSAGRCRAIVHLAARLGSPADSPTDVMTVNVAGTWNVLAAAEHAGAERVVLMSSVNALGVFRGEAPPRYLPIDDDHPCSPGTPYGMSKLLAEEMCERFSERTGIPSVCLRPPAVWDDPTIEAIVRAREERADFEWTPFWEYGCFIHVHDLADATVSALECAAPPHIRLLVNAPDISSRDATSRALVERLLPTTEWRGGSAYEVEPYRALMNTDRAQRVLDWWPRYRWRRRPDPGEPARRLTGPGPTMS